VGQIGGDDVGRLADLKVVLHSSAVLAYQLTVLLQFVGMVVGEERSGRGRGKGKGCGAAYPIHLFDVESGIDEHFAALE
jgi:hypothetical protein